MTDLGPRSVRIPSMASLRSFEATVRHGSVIAASRELNVTDGAVSRAIQMMEDQLGLILFVRSKRRLIATAAGAELADEVRQSLDRLVGAIDRARRSREEAPTLLLSCEPTLLIRWLIPRLDSLKRALGADHALRFVSAGGPVDFARVGADMAIRRADFRIGENLRAERFLKELIGPVCQPNRSADFVQSRRLTGHILHSDTRPDAWQTWAARAGAELRPEGESRFEHFYQSLQAAVAGVGVAIGPIALVADDLASGLLSAPAGFVPDGSDYVLLWPRDSPDIAGIEIVLDWLRKEASTLTDLAANYA